MQELVETLDGWTAEGAGVGRAVVVRTFGTRAAARGRRPARDRRRPARGLRVRRLRRGRGGRGDLGRPQARPRARDPLRDQRRAGVGRRARVRRHDRRADLAGRARCGGRRGARDARRAGATDGRSSRRSPRTRRQPAFGAHPPGAGREPAPPLVVHDDGRLEGSLGDRGADAALVDGRDRRARSPATSKTVEVGGPAAVHRGVPGPAAARGRRRGRGRAGRSSGWRRTWATRPW